jgi:hypothetical protein
MAYAVRGGSMMIKQGYMVAGLLIAVILASMFYGAVLGAARPTT